MEFPAPRTACGTHRHSFQICSKEVLSARHAPGAAQNSHRLLFLIIRRADDVQGGLTEPDAADVCPVLGFLPSLCHTPASGIRGLYYTPPYPTYKCSESTKFLGYVTYLQEV